MPWPLLSLVTTSLSWPTQNTSFTLLGGKEWIPTPVDLKLVEVGIRIPVSPSACLGPPVEVLALFSDNWRRSFTFSLVLTSPHTLSEFPVFRFPGEITCHSGSF